jgi:hypothetical protein
MAIVAALVAGLGGVPRLAYGGPPARPGFQVDGTWMRGFASIFGTPTLMNGVATGISWPVRTPKGTMALRVGGRWNLFAELQVEADELRVWASGGDLELRVGTEWTAPVPGGQGWVGVEVLAGPYRLDIAILGVCAGAGVLLGRSGPSRLRIVFTEACGVAPGAIALSTGVGVVFGPAPSWNPP